MSSVRARSYGRDHTVPLVATLPSTPCICIERRGSYPRAETESSHDMSQKASYPSTTPAHDDSQFHVRQHTFEIPCCTASIVRKVPTPREIYIPITWNVYVSVTRSFCPLTCLGGQRHEKVLLSCENQRRQWKCTITDDSGVGRLPIIAVPINNSASRGAHQYIYAQVVTKECHDSGSRIHAMGLHVVRRCSMSVKLATNKPTVCQIDDKH
ncbi:hypothetical protein BDN71DRAFT_1438278 [Pleurotus eryngii]|uniref:Uncharacterized protein n=1 Tax=Pleurotus eryngii TaxID=5323 RepID=A0A9P6ABH6_PLEER|nr:hypothetical protein BDN71DRAFT_1438278 [Pleurotus eryngii]